MRLQAPFEERVPAYRDAWLQCYPFQPHEPTVGLRDDAVRPFTFDFIFNSADLAPHVRSVRVASEIAGPDHQPMLIKLA